ncbi:unnamed protein product [Rotaria sp. Silwood2]|nr:unnamed protein product [Rotaria sp. Silwood2]CAF3093396.1 unnamed protein product [Rotaria sp. Silwood2]CAF3311192.1 unnamed protein product [Rotaria sp. Silwood2]CAF4097787.1 unnamed protein product [Rotaria sp. Silwood2]CAF4438695.1 unnamed protein product [Rotaria sp. Silwood2]
MPSHSSSSSCTSKNSNRGSSGKSQSRHNRNVRLEEQNNNYRRNYRPFTIPSSFYNSVHVHRFTTIDIMSTLINHFESCYRYSIDTESDRLTNELSLIQVHSIPQTLPSFIVLFELNHLPPIDTLLYEKIQLLFCVLFRLGNIIFSWGSISDELKPAVRMNLFTWPSLALLINLQDEFPGWYSRAQPSCKVCSPVQLSTTIMSSKSSCTCSNNSPYVNPGEKWSLQNAIRYTVNRFLDKSSTRKTWSIMLDPNYSPLSSSEQHQRIHYATSDCFAVTFLHQAIYEKWSITQLRETELISLFTSNAPPYSSSSFSSTSLEDISEDENETKATSLSISNAPRHLPLPLSTLLENISEDENEEGEDEIFVSSLSRHYDTNTLINSTRHVEIEPLIVSNVVTIEPTSLNQQLSTNEPPQLRRNCRSSSARTRRNHKRNKVKRLHRDQHLILRKIYHRFNLHQIKNILRNRDVRYVHLKLDKSSQVLSIGMKKSSLVDLYFDRLPGDLFDKEHYQQYRQHEH